MSTVESIFFFNDTATTEIYTLSLHDALPISFEAAGAILSRRCSIPSPVTAETAMSFSGGSATWGKSDLFPTTICRSEEHTSELQSHLNLVCRLLLEKKKKKVRQQE